MQTIDCRANTFDEWLKSVFAHPVKVNPWYYDCDVIEPDFETCIDYLTKLFKAPEVLDQYLDAQVRDGLYFLISNGCSIHTVALTDKKLAVEKRVECIIAMKDLFALSLSKRCSDHLSHLDQPNSNPINSVAYMWWDILPLCGQPTDRSFEKIDEAALEVMESTLELSSIACQESALHGLGHWHMHYPGRVEKTIDRYLSNRSVKSDELIRYARAAQQGCVN